MAARGAGRAWLVTRLNEPPTAGGDPPWANAWDACLNRKVETKRNRAVQSGIPQSGYMCQGRLTLPVRSFQSK
jgi:hypothetical protein